MKIGTRNTALDITRIVAFFSVVSIHFPMYTGFYHKTMIGTPMLIFTILRTAFIHCVPLFIMLSGYLLNQKKLSKKYYMGIGKTLGIYVLASVCCMLYKSFRYQTSYTFLNMLFGILDFTGANYAWYVEMYIGLFLLIPFFNIMYHGLNTKRQKAVLIFTLIGLTALPSIINIYNFTESGWFQAPILSKQYQPLIGDWWIALYPLTYYMIGAYLKEYPIKMKKRYHLLLLGVVITIFGLFNFYRDQGGIFSWGPYTDWYSMEALILAVLVFTFLSQRNTTGLSLTAKKFWAHVSDLCLGAYLISYIADDFLYSFLCDFVPNVTDRMYYFIPMVLLVGITALLLSQILNWIYKGIEAIIKLTGKTVTNKQKTNKER